MESLSYERIVFDLRNYDVVRGIQFGHYRYVEAKPGLENHVHKDALEVCFCIKGRQRYSINREHYILSGNEILIVPPNVPHSTGGYPEEKGELYWLQISTDPRLGKLCHLPAEQADYLLGWLIEKSGRVIKGAYGLKPLLDQLLIEMHATPNIQSKLTVHQMVLQLLLQVCKCPIEEPPTRPSKRMEVIDRFLLENLHRRIYVDELATLIGISQGYFKTWFREEAGVPPKEYINRLKVEQAKTDLLKKDSVTQTAFELGFNSSQYFSTVFRKFTGQTPSNYISSRNFNAKL